MLNKKIKKIIESKTGNWEDISAVTDVVVIGLGAYIFVTSMLISCLIIQLIIIDLL